MASSELIPRSRIQRTFSSGHDGSGTPQRNNGYSGKAKRPCRMRHLRKRLLELTSCGLIPFPLFWLSCFELSVHRNRQRTRMDGGEELHVKRAQQRGIGDLPNALEKPIDAYNFLKVRLSVSSLAEFSTYAHIRLPDIGEHVRGGAGLARKTTSMPAAWFGQQR